MQNTISTNKTYYIYTQRDIGKDKGQEDRKMSLENPLWANRVEKMAEAVQR